MPLTFISIYQTIVSFQFHPSSHHSHLPSFSSMLKMVQEEFNYRSCPFCNEWFADVPQDDASELLWKKVHCELPSCKNYFCGRCGQKPHKGQKDQNITCEEYAKWMQGEAESDASMTAYLKVRMGRGEVDMSTFNKLRNTVITIFFFYVLLFSSLLRRPRFKSAQNA